MLYICVYHVSSYISNIMLLDSDDAGVKFWRGPNESPKFNGRQQGQETHTRVLTDARVLPRVSPVVDCWFVVGAALGAEGAVVGTPGLWLYCNDAGDGAPVPLFAATAALPRNVDIGGREAALVTAEPKIGAADSPFGDIAEYA